MAMVMGCDIIASLRTLVVRLARECYFGDNVMASFSLSGKDGAGLTLMQLGVVYMSQIKNTIRQQTRNKTKFEFKAIWAKCLSSIILVFCHVLRSVFDVHMPSKHRLIFSQLL